MPSANQSNILFIILLVWFIYWRKGVCWRTWRKETIPHHCSVNLLIYLKQRWSYGAVIREQWKHKLTLSSCFAEWPLGGSVASKQPTTSPWCLSHWQFQRSPHLIATRLKIAEHLEAAVDWRINQCIQNTKHLNIGGDYKIIPFTDLKSLVKILF